MSSVEQILYWQENGVEMDSWWHNLAIKLIDLGFLGMAGFKYCTVKEAVHDAEILGIN